MPMFDDPQKELRRLQQQLLAEEEEYDEYEEDYLTEDEWLEQELAEAKALSGYQEPREKPIRNYANGYGTQAPQPRQSRSGYAAQPHQGYPPQQRGQYDPYQRSYLSGRSGYDLQDREAYRPTVRNYSEEAIEEEEEEKGVGGLVFLAILLTLGIVGVSAYWVLVLL